jgi:hypothetical protein
MSKIMYRLLINNMVVVALMGMNMENISYAAEQLF